MACCGSEGLFPGGGDYCVPGRNSSARVAPLDVSSHSSYRDVRKTASSRSQHSHDNLQLKASSSYSSGAGTPAQRKRPLALAVGFKYAEDVNGRPIVITPGNHRRPPVVVNSNRGPSTSPVHHHHHSPNKRDSFIVPPTAADVLFPLDLDPDAPRHQQQHLCYKPGISS